VNRVVIVGTSIGGVRTAQALRSEGYDGAILLIGQETDLPYDKPPLSKALLAGTTDVEAITLLTPEQAQADHIELLLGHRALRIDVASRLVELENYEPVRFDHLVVATGARARPSPWGNVPGVHVLRTLQDAQGVRADLLTGGSVVIVGGGFIGAEVASTTRLLGLEVTIVDPLQVPMSRVLNPDIGRWFVDLHRRHGVRSLFGVGVEAIKGHRGNLSVELTDGTRLQAATVVVGIGAQPNDGWLGGSGLIVDDGLVCNEYCRARDVANIYAVGDVARWFHPGRGTDIRIEHWTNAVDQAVCVAHNISHPDDLRSYAPVEYVWSDQHDWKIQVVGRPGGSAKHVLIGDPAHDDRFAALYTEDGTRLSAAAVVNWPRALIVCRRAVRAGGHLAEVKGTIEALANRPTVAGVAS